MLAALSIRDIVLIDHLELSFEPGLCVLTGETGAGKSILLDSLNLVLGTRADSALVRKGADKGAVSADFALPAGHPVFAILDEQEISRDPGGALETLLLRRSLNADGRSRAWINDQPVSVGLLRQVGDALVEIHGQRGEQGLLDEKTHLSLLDAFGGLEREVDAVRQAHEAQSQAREALLAAEQRLEAARRDEDYLRHVMEELDALDPQPGEEDELAQRRQMMMHAEKLTEDLTAALQELSVDGGVEARIRAALRHLERVAEKTGGRLEEIVAGLDRALAEAGEAMTALEAVGRELVFDPAELEQSEERLFALRAAARKHQVEVEELPAKREEFAAQLAALDAGTEELGELKQAVSQTEAAYIEAAKALSAARARAAGTLDAAVNAELPPLKLEKATFTTLLTPLPAERHGASGAESVAFQVATNPGSAPGPLNKIASGGELSRFALALKMVLAQKSSAPTLIFDEIDQGVGGAVAAAVGERLARLTGDVQVLVVTHSPQVAARGDKHLRVEKSGDDATRTSVSPLEGGARLEEVARMLSGAQITDEARAAAQKLMGDQA